ncbi:hypothetical protein FO519_007562 [Halicephalobus sp. NKZ332]|nr:hypothetical protein FO519_007562 [Halicephalobus sp. NKZ332]
MQSTVILLGVALALCIISSYAQQYDLDEFAFEKRAPMRNALVRFGRAGMRNALVRFGKRATVSDEYPIIPDYALEAKRNGAPQPFVRFGRSAGRIDHMHDILNTLQKIELANSQ